MTRVNVTDTQIHAAQGGDDMAMWDIVQAFDGMFSSMIRSAAPKATSEDAEDLLQEARAVLIQHVRDYKSDTSSAKLTSFVFQAARRRIAEEAIRNSLPLTVDPTAVLRVRRALWHANGNVEKAWETLSTCSNAAGRMERDRFMGVLEALTEVERLDAPAGGEDSDGSSLTLADVLPDTSTDIVDATRRQDLARWLLSEIPQRQAFALRAFHGIQMTRQDDTQTCTDLGVKPSRLRDLRTDGIRSARKVAAEHGISA
ncbi:hypothetical protein AB0E81_11165 [Streptomyces sp. NPDC033538]|uniref:hypothetical protein n=1 Tax=Streptomyces sp. NPDC033538 TaxID=3155367 RepID=UPI0033E1E488